MGNGGYNVNITNSTFVSDHKSVRVYWDVLGLLLPIPGLKLSTVLGMDPMVLILSLRTVSVTGKGLLFNNNGSHGLSAAQLIIKNSVVTANDNGMYGITYTGKMEMDSTSQVYIYRNALESSGGGLRADNEGNTSTVEAGAVMEICDNGHKWFGKNYGSFAFKMVQSSPLLATTSVPPTVVVFSRTQGKPLRYLKCCGYKQSRPSNWGGICNAGTATILGKCETLQ